MATDNKRIVVSELDFDTIKSNLKQYLTGQSEFSDYNFEGSALSILLDVLAYNTHYSGLYDNLAINEMFLDSAVKRNNVVSLAKELGYIPHSATCSQAVVDVVVTNTATAASTMTLSALSTFTSNVVGNTYTFYTLNDITAVRRDNAYVFENILIKEGTPLTYKYIVADGVRYIIPTQDVDLNTLTVRVQDSVNSTNFTTFTRSDTILNVTSTDNVFFIKEIDNQQYELTFGDGVVGSELSNGSVVHMFYMKTNKAAANDIRLFNYSAGSDTDGGTISVTTVTPSFNGSELESLASIKFNAPKSYTAQNRAITSEDYKTLIYNNFPEATAVSVWGGETVVPPQYGKVYISIIPQTLRTLTDTEKSYILDTIISPRKALTITPEIIDPVYIRIQLDITYYYNPQLTTRKTGDISTLVQQNVELYNQESLNEFNGIFKYSHLSRMVDGSEPSILSNITTVKLHREITPLFNINSPYNINLGNPIYNSGATEESIITTGFYCTDSQNICYIDDMPSEGQSIGALRLFYYNSSGQKVVIRNVGTVNYTSGLINISSLNITALFGQSWDMIIKPQSNDVVSTQNQFAQIDQSLLTINAIADYPTKTYTFTSSRN